jgi:hypothetical protein
MEIVIRPASIPRNDCTWTSMLQLQVILLAAEPTIGGKATGLERIATLHDSDEHRDDCEHEQDSLLVPLSS